MDEHKLSSKASGATPAGALTRPTEETSHIFEGRNSMYTPIPSVILPAEEKGNFIAQKQVKITKDHRREAIERYKHIATYVAIFPVLGRSERRRKEPSP